MQHLVARVQVGEAAEILGVDRRTVHRFREQGLLTPLSKKDGQLGAWQFAEAEVRELAAERRAELEAKLARMGVA